MIHNMASMRRLSFACNNFAAQAALLARKEGRFRKYQGLKYEIADLY